MGVIYHVTGRDEWERAQEQGFYTAPSLESEGFIHCSEEGQVAGVLKRYFAGRSALVRLVIDVERLEAPLRYERSAAVGEDFPHVYGVVNLGAVVGVEGISG